MIDHGQFFVYPQHSSLLGGQFETARIQRLDAGVKYGLYELMASPSNIILPDSARAFADFQIKSGKSPASVAV
jgi:hypothetical protein